jgi:hypothetical protein
MLSGLLPLPPWLSAFLTQSPTSGTVTTATGSSAAGAAGLVAKTAAVVATGMLAGSVVSAGVTHVGRHGAIHPSSNVPTSAKRLPHDAAWPLGKRAPGPALYDAARSVPIEPHGGLSGKPGTQPAHPTTRGPERLDSGGLPALGHLNVPHTAPGTSHESRASAAPNGHGVRRPAEKPAKGLRRSNHDNGNGAGASGAAGISARGTVSPAKAHPKPTIPPAPTHSNATADPAFFDPASTHDREHRAQNAGAQESVPVGVVPTAGIPGQSDPGGNRHN